MPRGDIYPVSFTVYASETEVSDIDFTQIYMSCKKKVEDRNVLFQKTLTGGTITKLDTGIYQFRIEPEDTNNLKFGDYVFDIELIYENEIKQTLYGTLRLSEEVTTAENEVR